MSVDYSNYQYLKYKKYLHLVRVLSGRAGILEWEGCVAQGKTSTRRGCPRVVIHIEIVGRHYASGPTD
jgi:hypothetical protein